MKKNDLDIESVISEIEAKSDSDSRYYGQLIKWKCKNQSQEQNNKTWFYGIGLSDSHIFDTRNLCVTFRGDKDKSNYLAIFIVKYEHNIFTTFDIIDRLKYTLLSIDSSNQELHINKYYRDNWDDEHLSRLIVTGRAISYKADPHKKKGNHEKVKTIKDFIKNNHKQTTDDHWLLSFLSKWPFLSIIVKFLKKNWFWVLVSLTVGVTVIILEPQMLAFSPKSILSTVLIIFFLVISVVSFSKYQWSGFQNKKFWDWLELLFVPIILTLGVFFLEVQAESRQERLELLKQEQQTMTEYVKNVKDVIKVTNNSEDDKLKFRTGSTFKNSDLEGADLRGAKLFGVNWERVYLNNVIIDQQGFETLDLKTKLVYSIFNKPEIFDKPQKFKNMYQKFKNPHIFANFFRVANNNDKQSNTPDGIDLTNSVLRCAKFSLTLNNNNNSKLNMSNVDMSKSDLTAAEFNNTDLNGAKFTGADMKYIDMIDVNLEDAYLFVADLTGAKIKGSLTRANLNSAIVIGADLSEVTGLDKAELYGVAYDDKTKFPKDAKTEKQEDDTLKIKIYSGQGDSYNSYEVGEETVGGKTVFTIYDLIEEEETNVK